MADVDLEALRRAANGLADVLNLSRNVGVKRVEVADLLAEAHRRFVEAIAALERLGRLEAAAHEVGEYDGSIWQYPAGMPPEKRPALSVPYVVLARLRSAVDDASAIKPAGSDLVQDALRELLRRVADRQRFPDDPAARLALNEATKDAEFALVEGEARRG